MLNNVPDLTKMPNFRLFETDDTRAAETFIKDHLLQGYGLVNHHMTTSWSEKEQKHFVLHIVTMARQSGRVN